MHHRGVRLFGKDELGQLHFALSRAGGIEKRHLERILNLLLIFAGRGNLLGGRLGRGRSLGCGLGHSLGGGRALRHQTFLPVGLPAGPLTFIGLLDWRTSTRAPLAPGTPPLTKIKFRSASIRTTLYARAVTRSLPIWPDIFRPLKTRAESVEPIAPGCLTFIEPCDSGPRLNLCLLMRPWKPLPLEVDVTSTISPALKISAFSSWPASRPS